jgi:putative CocE/NonD family hydrolase
VPIRPRPSGVPATDATRDWAVADQRFVDGRPDVVSFVSEPLTEPVQVSGAPVVNLYASTSGSDSDWVVKIIDVYPYTYPADPPMGGYEFPLSMDIFRGRYRTDFARPARIEPDQPLLYTFALPNINHLFKKGHRIMVQVQSSWFPLYDRNPQTWVDSIFFAKPGDYQETRQKVWHTPSQPSSISMPIVPGRPH